MDKLHNEKGADRRHKATDQRAWPAASEMLKQPESGKDEDARHNRSDNPVIERSVRHPASMLALSITSLVLASAMGSKSDLNP